MSASASSSASSSAAAAAVPVRARDRSQEMVLFDIETNIFPIELIEFGAIIVDKFSYVELERCHTMIQPPSGGISSKATKIHGITFEHVKHAPFFAAIAPRIFDALDGRVWVGHNINSFDVPHILKAFETASLAPPKPCATLDTLPLVRRIFGKRAGDCKMATLGAYFGLGVEKHRAVEDSEMTLQALKCIGLHNLLEREMPETFPAFVEADKKESKPKPAAAASSSSPDADKSVDKLADALAGGLAIDAGEKKSTGASKPKKEKKQSDSIDAKKPLSPSAAPFIDPSLLGAAVPASSGAPVAANASIVDSSIVTSASAAPREQKEDDGWQVQHSKKAVKAEQKSIKDQEAAAQAMKARKEKQQQKSQSASDRLPQPQRERSSSVGSNSSGKGENKKQESSASSWLNKVKATIPPGGVKLEPSASPQAPNPLSRSTSDQQKPSSAAPATTLSSTASSSSSSTAPLTAASVSPGDRSSLHSTIDYYVANPHLRCELAYAGGKHPEKTKIITNFTWERRPVLFKALLEGNSHGNEPIFFSVTKIVSLTLLP